MNERISSISRICKNLLKSSQLLGNLLGFYFAFMFKYTYMDKKDQICIFVWVFKVLIDPIFYNPITKSRWLLNGVGGDTVLFGSMYIFFTFYMILLRFFIIYVRVIELVDSESLWESFFNCCTSLPQAVTASLVESALLILQKKVSFIKVIHFPI